MVGKCSSTVMRARRLVPHLTPDAPFATPAPAPTPPTPRSQVCYALVITSLALKIASMVVDDYEPRKLFFTADSLPARRRCYQVTACV